MFSVLHREPIVNRILVTAVATALVALGSAGVAAASAPSYHRSRDHATHYRSHAYRDVRPAHHHGHLAL